MYYVYSDVVCYDDLCQKDLWDHGKLTKTNSNDCCTCFTCLQAEKTFDVTVSICFACAYDGTTFWIHLLHCVRNIGLKYLLNVDLTAK